MRRAIVLPFLMALLFSLFPVVSAPSPLAETVVRLDPATIELGPEYCVGETFTLAAKIDDVEELAGLGLQITWNTIYLEYVGHTMMIPIEDHPGGIMHEPVLVVANTVNETLGTYDCAVAALGGAPFYGSGTAFEITLRLIHQPIAPEPDVRFQVKFTSHILADPYPGPPIPHSLQNCNVTIHALPHIPITIYVPDDYSTIQEAINNANNGDLILVSGGPYTENVVVNQSVALIAETQNVTIRGLNFSVGAVIVQSDDVSVIGFKVENQYGIVLNSSSSTTITGNFLDTALGKGIVIEGGDENNIVNNKIATCTTYGISLYDTNHNLIMGNSMNCHDHSILLMRSHFNYIYDNFFSVHWGTIPITLYSSNNNTIEGNTLWSDFETFFQLDDSNGNLMFHNNVYGGLTGVKLWRNNVGNSWDNGQEGNYWWDYSGNDTNGDGIGDTPIVFDMNNSDNYPLMNPYSRWNRADINYDFVVDIYDVVLACTAYDSTAADPRWNPYVDLAERYGFIDIFDIVMICRSYGEEYTP